MKKLINKIATRKFILDVANEQCGVDSLPAKDVDSTGKTWNYSRCNTGLKRFNSVSQDYIDMLDVEFRKMIADKLKSNPPRGKTVK
jgi:hypothetical protein